MLNTIDAADSIIRDEKRRKKEEKKAKREQRRRTEDRRRVLRKITLIAVLFAVISILGYGIYVSAVSPPAIVRPGPVGSAHEHAVLVIFLEGKPMEVFHQPKYQLVDDRVHFEDGDGFTVHTHARSVTLRYFFETLKMRFSYESLVLDDGRSFVPQDNKTLKLYVNRLVNTQYENYVIKDRDRILISFGNDDQTEIARQLDYVDQKAVGRIS